LKDSKVKVNGIDFHVVDFGGKGETILCVHGLSSNSRIWDAVAERLTDRFHVIAIDLRGRGDSQKPESGYHISQHVEDVKGILDHFGIAKAIYMGHSLGAIIGCAFAAAYPTRLSQLLLVDGGADVEPLVLDLLRPSIDRLGKTFPDFHAYLDEMKKTPFFPEWNEYVEQHYYADAMHLPSGEVQSKVSKDAILQEVDAMGKFSINALHEKIKTPTLILWAPQCLLHPSAFVLQRAKGEEMASLIPESRFTAIEGSNHFTIILTKYEELVKEIRSFLLN
jgi:pimeloyl-ACP methyl ester carboxylesterase